MSEEIILLSLIVILGVILVAPLLSRKVEHNLEVFFLIMGVLALTLAGKWNIILVEEALLTPLIIRGFPLGIFQVVLLAGIIFVKYERELVQLFASLDKRISTSFLTLLLVFLLGIGSSIISVIVASVILAEIVRIMFLPKKAKVKVLVASAYALGAGASLTPLGEPLSTIAIYKLSGEPYHADFLFLFNLLGSYVIPIIIVLSIYCFYVVRKELKKGSIIDEVITLVTPNIPKGITGRYYEVILRAIKIYVFIVALVLLGASFDILVERYIKFMSPELVYFFGSLSAAVDNATLAAAIISPELTLFQIKSFLISLLISGGFLIPGNVPNIVIAYIYKIAFKQWFKIAIPIGLPIFFTAFFFLFFVEFL